jgi:hypothetical protein
MLLVEFQFVNERVLGLFFPGQERFGKGWTLVGWFALGGENGQLAGLDTFFDEFPDCVAGG